MSRSFSKRYRICDGPNHRKKFWRRMANKVIRQMIDFCFSGALYKRFYDSYKICDGGRSRLVSRIKNEEIRERLKRK